MQEKSKKRINNIFHSEGLSDTEKFAKQVAKNAKVNDVFCLEGDLGVGKTVFAKAIGKFFNVKESITSPTFTILKTYKTQDKKIKRIHHFDLYRIKSVDELYNIGFEDFISDNESIILIEWPEIALDLLNNHYKYIKIEKTLNDLNNDNIRNIYYEEHK